MGTFDKYRVSIGANLWASRRKIWHKGVFLYICTFPLDWPVSQHILSSTPTGHFSSFDVSLTSHHTRFPKKFHPQKILQKLKYPKCSHLQFFNVADPSSTLITNNNYSEMLISKKDGWYAGPLAAQCTGSLRNHLFMVFRLLEVDHHMWSMGRHNWSIYKLGL